MAFIQCPLCGKHTSDLAASCALCQTPLSTEEPCIQKEIVASEGASQPAATPAPTVSKSVTRRQIIFAVLGIFVGIYAISSLLGLGGPSNDVAAGRERRAETAYTMSKDYVRAQLKAPSTAKFPWYDPSFVHQAGPGQFEVRAYVDAQNAFGAAIRSHYYCELHSTDGERWILKNIVFF